MVSEYLSTGYATSGRGFEPSCILGIRIPAKRDAPSGFRNRRAASKRVFSKNETSRAARAAGAGSLRTKDAALGRRRETDPARASRSSQNAASASAGNVAQTLEAATSHVKTGFGAAGKSVVRAAGLLAAPTTRSNPHIPAAATGFHAVKSFFGTSGAASMIDCLRGCHLT